MTSFFIGHYRLPADSELDTILALCIVSLDHWSLAVESYEPESQLGVWTSAASWGEVTLVGLGLSS